jgi:hypothetical protein
MKKKQKKGPTTPDTTPYTTPYTRARNVPSIIRSPRFSVTEARSEPAKSEKNHANAFKLLEKPRTNKTTTTATAKTTKTKQKQKQKQNEAQ